MRRVGKVTKEKGGYKCHISLILQLLQLPYMKRKKLYILIDNYEKLDASAQFALKLAKKLNRPAVFVAIEKVSYPTAAAAISGTAMPPYELDEAANLEAAIRPKLERLCMNHRNTWPYIDYEVAIGFPIAQVIGMTKAKHPHLLVLEGRNQPSTLNEWFGTIETDIAGGADCPVLVVPPSYQWQAFQKILYLMDAEDAKVENMRYLSAFSKRTGADLQVVLLSEKSTREGQTRHAEMKKVFKSLLDYKDITFHHVVASKEAEKVQHLVTETRPDCLAIEQKSKPFVQRLLNDYHTQRIVLQSEIPVLVL